MKEHELDKVWNDRWVCFHEGHISRAYWSDKNHFPVWIASKNKVARKASFTLLAIILITVLFPFYLSTSVQSEVVVIYTAPVAMRCPVSRTTVTEHPLPVMKGSASLLILIHTRKSEASTFLKISEQTCFIHGYLAALRNRQTKTSISLRHVKKNTQLCFNGQNMSVAAKAIIFSLFLCR